VAGEGWLVGGATAGGRADLRVPGLLGVGVAPCPPDLEGGHFGSSGTERLTVANLHMPTSRRSSLIQPEICWERIW